MAREIERASAVRQEPGYVIVTRSMRIEAELLQGKPGLIDRIARTLGTWTTSELVYRGLDGDVFRITAPRKPHAAASPTEQTRPAPRRTTPRKARPSTPRRPAATAATAAAPGVAPPAIGIAPLRLRQATARRAAAGRATTASPAAAAAGSAVPRQPRQDVRDQRGDDQSAARRGRRSRRPWPLGGRPDPRGRSLGDRHARRAHQPLCRFIDVRLSRFRRKGRKPRRAADPLL